MLPLAGYQGPHPTAQSERDEVGFSIRRFEGRGIEPLECVLEDVVGWYQQDMVRDDGADDKGQENQGCDSPHDEELAGWLWADWTGHGDGVAAARFFFELWADMQSDRWC